MGILPFSPLPPLLAGPMVLQGGHDRPAVSRCRSMEMDDRMVSWERDLY